MLELFSELSPKDPALLRELDQRIRDIVSGPRGDTGLVARIEAEVARAPLEHISFDETGLATLHAAGRSFRAGRFHTPSLGDLRVWAAAALAQSDLSRARLAFWILDGASPATDIGALQAHAPPGAIFQVASQFNCLEAPDAFVAPVASYLHDPTQGPRASISALPGTFVRHYAAPDGDGGRFVQRTDELQLDLLRSVSRGARVQNGYLLTSNIHDPAEFVEVLTEHHDGICIGLHDGVEVVFGHAWSGHVPDAPELHVAQALTSSVAAGGYSQLASGDEQVERIVRQLQRAAYLGTLLGAAWLGKSYACLTLIGGGVFGNPHDVIFDSILWALGQVEPYLRRDLTVVLNGYNIGRHLPRRKLWDAAVERGGGLLCFDGERVTVG